MNNKKLPAILFYLYLLVLLNITVIRNFNFRGRSINLTLIIGYIPIFRNSISRFIYLFVGNLVWFMPFGFFLVFYKKKSFWKTVFFGFLLSLFIEVMQYILGTGVSEVDDLILNTLGCIIGAVIGLISLHRRLD